jgi:hypothetical protein
VPGKLLDRMKVRPHGVRRVVTTLQLIEHQLAKMGHRNPPCDPNPNPAAVSAATNAASAATAA